MANASRHALYLVAESAYGTLPATPSFIRVRNTGTTLATTKETNVSEELSPDRQIKDFRHGTKQVGGDINFELSYGSFDKLIEAVMMGTWTEVDPDPDPIYDVLKAGVTRRSFSVLRHFTDILSGGKPFHTYLGVEFNTFSLTMAPGAIITGSFGVLGREPGLSTTAPAGSTLGSPSSTKVFDTFTGSLEENNTLIGIVTELNFTLENGLEPRFVLFDDRTINPSEGRSNATGQVTVYFEDATMLEKFLDETPSSLDATVTDEEGNSYRFYFPHIKYTGGQPDVTGEGPITLAMPFQAIYDETEESQLVIERHPAA